MEQSDSIKELAEALAIAQGELKNVTKSGNGNYGKYAELGPTLDEVRPIISKHGLAVTQLPTVLENGDPGLATQLMHKSGEWLRATMKVLNQQNTPQAQGSGITYARRYALTAVLGIAGDDDDGQAGTDGPKPGTKPQQASPQPPKVPISKMITAAQAGLLVGMAKEATGLTERDEVIAYVVKIAGKPMPQILQSEVEGIKKKFKAGDGAEVQV